MLPRVPRKNGVKLLLFTTAVVLLGVLVFPAAALALQDTWSTAPRVGPQDANTTTTAAPGAGSASTATTAGAATPGTTATPGPSTTIGASGSPGSSVVPGGSPSDANLVPPGEGFSPLNPGWTTDQLDVQIWPEYDARAVLVFFSFSLPADVQLPATFKFAIPKGAVIAGIGERGPTGAFKYNYANSYPPVEPGELWDIATIQVQDYRSLQIDYYYDPGIPAQAGQRSLPLLLQVPLDVGTLLLHVQQPARSTDFTVQPALQGAGTAEDGFTYSVAAFSGVTAGTTLGQVVSYYKPDGGLSIDSDQPSASTSKISTNTVLLAAILVVVVCVGALVVYRLYRSSAKTKPGTRRPGSRPGPVARQEAPARKTPPGKKTRAAKRLEDEESGSEDTEDEPRPKRRTSELLCAECGEALSPRDESCPSCGASRED